MIGSTVFQCPLCDVQSGRKDNVLRHIRNLHSAEKFEEIIKKISKTVARLPIPDAVEQSVIVSIVDTKEKVDSIQTSNICQYQSVIRFAGRSEAPSSESLAQPISQRSEKEETTKGPEIPPIVRLKTPPPIQVVENNDYSTETIATNVPSTNNSDNIQSNPLNKELHVELAEPSGSGQVVSNINIYRQLLSPYLRPPPNLDDRNGTEESAKRRGYQVQGDRLPKRKENVEIYRSILMSSDQQEHQPSVIQNSRADVAEESVNSTKNPATIVIHGQSSEYFSEMHWRKRTSQCFNRMEQ